MGVARRQFSLQGEWDLPGVNGLTLTSRVNAVGDVYADSANLTRVPGWTTYELGLRYATKAGGMPMTLRASVQNVGDKRYWRQGAYAATPGMPRTLAVSSTFEF
ncbi:Ferrichrome receptor FcuA [bioreactor metagenome]|uniref:Ferrichrome receptor FcuA n=1 Tax=bioreactor metagenome TaxID=1076179 RepID=A0A645I433_9ZZZZ